MKLEILSGRKAIFVLIFGLKFSKSVAVITLIVSSAVYCTKMCILLNILSVSSHTSPRFSARVSSRFNTRVVSYLLCVN